MAALSSNTELMAAIRGLSAARELPPEIVLDALKAALKSAYDKIPGRTASEVTVEISETTGAARVYGHYAVTEAAYIEDPLSQLTVEQASEHNADAMIGDLITVDVTPQDFGRIAAQTAKQVILQRIREAEREQTYLTYSDREGEIVYGTVQTVNRDVVTVALDRVEGILPRREQIPGERYSPNQRVRVYVAEVKRALKGPQIIVSRAHKQMLMRLMELEIPEIFQGTVEVKGIAREAGNRSKVAVWSHQDGVDPVGACVGMRGVRIQALVRELGGEKIDVVEWDPDPRVFIKHALSPARVMFVALEEAEEKIAGPIRGTAAVIVPDDQLSLAIGREGQNARLAAKLTGWRIDIRAESESTELLEQLRAEDEIRRAERARRLAAERERAAEELVVSKPSPAAEESQEEDEDALEPAAAAAESATADAAQSATDEAADKAAAVTAEEPIEPATEPAAAAADAVADSAPDEAGDEVAEVEAPEQEEEKKEEEEEPAAASVVEPERKPAAKKAKRPKHEFDDELELDEDEEGQGKRRGRRLVRDPKTGRVYAEKRRKRSRRDWRDEVDRWTGEDDFDFDEDAMAFTEDDFLGGEDDELDEDGQEGAAQDESAEESVGQESPTDDGDEAGGSGDDKDDELDGDEAGKSGDKDSGGEDSDEGDDPA